MSEPDDSKMSPLRKQIAIIFASSVVLTFACCGGGAALDQSSSSGVSALLNTIGFLAFLASVFTAIAALLKMVFGGGL
jgi:hypothetical protein